MFNGDAVEATPSHWEPGHNKKAQHHPDDFTLHRKEEMEPGFQLGYSNLQI